MSAPPGAPCCSGAVARRRSGFACRCRSSSLHGRGWFDDPGRYAALAASESQHHPGSKPELTILVADLRGTAVDEAHVWDDGEAVGDLYCGIRTYQQPAASVRCS